MYLTILDRDNQPIMSAKLKHFSLHTSACESHIYRMEYSDEEKISKCNAVYNVLLSDIQVHNEKELLLFEDIHRLDHTNLFSGSKVQENRSFYVFVEPKLRGDYSWNITESGYRK